MPIPTNKQELLEAIKKDYALLKKELVELSPASTQKKELEGHAKGSRMSISNLVAYLIGWGALVLKWNRLKEKGEAVDFPETDFKWTELGPLANKFYKDYEADSFPKLLLKLDRVVAQIIQLIEACENSDLYETVWYKTYSKGRMIQLNTSSPYKNARKRIRKWKQQQGTLFSK